MVYKQALNQPHRRALTLITMVSQPYCLFFIGIFSSNVRNSHIISSSESCTQLSPELSKVLQDRSDCCLRNSGPKSIKTNSGRT